MNLSRETLERWYGEVEILKRLDHPNIVKAQNVPEGLNCSPMSNTPFICMEYCDGGDLRQVRVCVCVYVGGEVGREGGGKEWRMRKRRERVRGGERGTLCMKMPLSDDTISRFFEILKTVVDYLRRQSDKSVMTSVS